MKLFPKSRALNAKFRYFFPLLLFVLFSLNTQSQCPGSDIVQDPQDFVWTYHPVTANNPEAYYSGVMEVGEATFVMNNGETLTTRAYRQQGGSYNIPGPTIKVEPGQKYVLSLHNTLPFEPLNPNHNIFKDPNATNIHTHGLHISGETPSDDITRVFEGGYGGDFVWEIPDDHMGGTYWYHAHHHGSTFLQVSGGLFGLLIVDDSGDGIPSTVAAMDEREFVLGFLDPAAAGTGGDVLLSGTLSSTWTVNGLIDGNICIPPDTWQHWRVLLADRNANMKTIEFGPECEVKLLARDGVWRTVAPKDLATNSLELTGASRADFAIRMTPNNPNSWIRINGTTVANIYAEGTSDPSAHPFDTDGVSTWSALRPDYLRDLQSETNVNFESVSMGARTINGSKWDIDVPTFTLPANQVQEWSLSGAVQHPFHLHVYHVQALEDDGDFEAGEYYDVVSAKIDVRFDLNAATSTPYDGRTVLHCHILSHEDRGAMGWLDVDGGLPAPSFPIDGDLGQAYDDLYPLGGAPPPPAAPSNLVATATSSSSIDLTWDDNSSDEDGFEIERSTDGLNFGVVNTVGAGSTAFSDNGLAASTTYYYRVSAFNAAAGNSTPSNVASATTDQEDPGGGLVMHVDAMSITREPANGQNRFQAVATVTILDAGDAPVSGATVDGSFTGPNSSTASGTTDANGQVSMTSKAQKDPQGNWCFDVTNVSLAGATYDPSANVVTQVCETSNFWTINKAGSTSTDFKLLSVYPNPFRNSTQIAFRLQEPSQASLVVYSTLGERVAVITDQSYGAGQHFLEWTPGDLGNGTYFLQLKAGNLVETGRVVLIR